jgi:hypothetical protein
MREGVVIINPLAGALAHYSRELRDSLEGHFRHVEVLSIEEPSLSGKSKFYWLFQYLRTLVKARRFSGFDVIVTWPVLGYLDVILLRVCRLRDCHLVVHDPKPLVSAVGYNSFVAKVADRVGGVCIIAHSETAEKELREVFKRLTIRKLLHPILRVGIPRSRSPQKDLTVRVLGQYKISRDLQVMEKLASNPEFESVKFEIVGRGWPDVPGWSKESQFVSESRLEELLASATAVVIPYSRFYQSGIAIRALENLCPVVGPLNSSLREVFEERLRLLADSSDWATSLRYAIELNTESLLQMRTSYQSLVERDVESIWGLGARQ